LDQADEFRAALITMGAYPTLQPRHLAIALVASLMSKAQVSRAAIQRAVIELAKIDPANLRSGRDKFSMVAILDGTCMVVGGTLYRLDTLEELAKDFSAPEPLVATVFSIPRAFAFVE
jgi:hypothetical protein